MTPRAPDPLPLLHWRHHQTLAVLRDERANLMRRLKNLRPHAHRRLILLARLTELTAMILRAESDLKNHGEPHG
jgi:hypothetical protein